MNCHHDSTLEAITCDTCMGSSEAEAEYRAYQDANSVSIGELLAIAAAVFFIVWMFSEAVHP